MRESYKFSNFCALLRTLLESSAATPYAIQLSVGAGGLEALKITP